MKQKNSLLGAVLVVCCMFLVNNFTYADDEAMTIDSQGNVGINTSAPTAQLEVNGDVKLNQELNVAGESILAGNVGIGNDAPSCKLDVTGAIKSSGLITASNGINVIAGKVGIGTSTPASKLDVVGGITVSNGITASNGINVVSGKVGIGTSTPSTKLHVVGTGKVEGDLTVTGVLKDNTGKNYVNYLVPSGAIIMWSGSTSDIPVGWNLCNGGNGTPDLRNKFIVGAGGNGGDYYPVGETGGNRSITLTEDQLPEHTHGEAGSHSHDNIKHNGHSVKWGDGPGHGTTYIDSTDEQENSDDGSGYLSTSSAGNHTHNSVGKGDSIENRPPYYALCFIMKT